MINKQHGKTPYDLWKGRKPNVSYFHVFGSKCFIHNNGSQSLKTFDPKADEGIFLGYAKNGKNFRILNKIKSKVEESIHVVFDDANQEPSKVNLNDVGVEDLCHQASKITIDEDTDDDDEISVLPPKNTREINLNYHVRNADDHEENDHQEQTRNCELEAPTQESGQAHDSQAPVQPQIPFQPDRLWLRDHPPEQIIGDIGAPVRTRATTFNEAMFASFLS